MAQISTISRWGMHSAFSPVTQLTGGLNAVVPNIGIAIQIFPVQWSQRVTHLSWRVDLAPDLPAFTVAAPILWRVLIGQAIIPTDISALQAQAFPNGARPEIPTQRGPSTSINLLHDEWLNFGCSPLGLNQLFTREFPDGGPTCGPSAYLCAILCPIIDQNFPNTGANSTPAFAQMTLGLWGTSANAGAFGGDPLGISSQEPSLARFGNVIQSR